MKKRYLFFGVVVMLIGSVLYFTELGNVRYTKTLKYKNFSVGYYQYLLGRRKFSEGHYLSNELLYKQANRELALVLCEDYRTTKSIDVKAKIISIATEFSDTRERNIDSILRHSADIFNTNLGIE